MGGLTIHALCPVTEHNEYHQDFRTGARNQTMPLFVSSLGRYIWSDDPFKVDAKDGVWTFEGGSIEVVNAGSALREAYTAAQTAHFPCDGVKLEPRFFQVPQYNS